MKSVSRRSRIVVLALTVILNLGALPMVAGVNGSPRRAKESPNPIIRFIQRLFQPRVTDDLTIPKG